MAWWLWALVGLVLVGVEVVTPGGFFVIFFGVAALVVAALVGLDVAGPDWLQWLLFSVLAVGSLVLFRRRLVDRFRDAGGQQTGNVVGEIAVLRDDLPPGAVGKAEMRGTSWSVRHDGDAVLLRGQRCRVTRLDGLTLWVRAE
jgi:membrane protein implicated in regulation of membrane protease activity